MNTVRTHRVSIAILLLFAVIVTRFPLFDYLGYEFSTAVALLLPWVIGGSVIRSLRKKFPDRASIRFTRTDSYELARRMGIFLGIPFAAAIINGFFVKNCAYGEGFVYYMLLPGVTAVWTAGFAVLCWIMFRRALLAYHFTIAALFLYSVYSGYASPQIYSYNIIYGFFPGFSYDEVLTITSTLLLFRLVTLMSALLCILASVELIGTHMTDRTWFFKLAALYRIRKMNGRRLAIIVITLAMIATWMFRERLGFETSSQFVQSTLGGRYTTEHFDIYYSPKQFSGDEIARAGMEHEFRLSQVVSALQVNLHGKISSYIYPDDDVQHQLIGTRSTNIAKPWRREIHLGKNSWQGTLKHELVHVVAGEFGMPVIRAHYNIGLVEGLATAIDGEFGNRTLNEYAAAMKTFRLVHDPGSLIQPWGFAVRASTVSYVMMGSFCTYLIDRYGIMRFKELYGGRSIESVYEKSYEMLVDEWQRVLDRIIVPESWRTHVLFYFNRPSIFAKECARIIARLNDNAYRAMSADSSAVAMEIFSEALRRSWNTESFAGLVRSSYGAGRYDTVVRLMTLQLQDTLRRNGIANLFALYGDALWKSNDTILARKAYEEMRSLDLSDRTNEAIALRIAAIADDTLRHVLPDFFTGTLTDSAAQVFLSHLHATTHSPIVPYLEAKLLMKQKRFNEVVAKLSLLDSTRLVPVLEAGREQMIAQAFFEMKQYQQARIHIWQSLNFIASGTSRRRVDDWLERCAWYEKHF